MTTAVVTAHKAALIAGLKHLYREGGLSRAGGKVSNGRGGFTTTAGAIEPAWVQREDDTRELARRNISLEKSLIFILATLTIPTEGDVAILDNGAQFRIGNVSLDPVGAVYECVCDRA